MDGAENPYVLHREMASVMSEHVGIVRDNEALRKAAGRIQDLQVRFRRLGLPDKGAWANQPLAFLNQLDNMLELCRIVVAGALARDESRGAHYKPAFPKRDDAKWLKTTIADYAPDGPKLSYEPVDTSILAPVERKYA